MTADLVELRAVIVDEFTGFASIIEIFSWLNLRRTILSLVVIRRLQIACWCVHPLSVSMPYDHPFSGLPWGGPYLYKMLI